MCGLVDLLSKILPQSFEDSRKVRKVIKLIFKVFKHCQVKKYGEGKA